MSATAGPRAGIDGAVYRNTGSAGSPTWVEIEKVKDVIPGMAWDMVEAGSRETVAKLYEKTRIDLGAQLVARADAADAGYQALYDAALSKTAQLDLLVLDGPITEEGASGFRAMWKVNVSGGPTQGIDELQYTTFDLKGSWHATIKPRTVDVGASSALTEVAF